MKNPQVMTSPPFQGVAARRAALDPHGVRHRRHPGRCLPGTGRGLPLQGLAGSAGADAGGSSGSHGELRSWQPAGSHRWHGETRRSG